MPGTAKVIAIFVLAVKENAAEVRASTAIKYFDVEMLQDIFWEISTGSSDDSTVF